MCVPRLAGRITLYQQSYMRARKLSPFLVKPSVEDSGRALQTGKNIPRSGIYRVIHTKHRLPHEVTLLKNEQFPRCAKCRDDVSFELLRAADGEWDVISDQPFRVRLYELPEIEDEGDDKKMAV